MSKCGRFGEGVAKLPPLEGFFFSKTKLALAHGNKNPKALVSQLLLSSQTIDYLPG